MDKYAYIYSEGQILRNIENKNLFFLSIVDTYRILEAVS